MRFCVCVGVCVHVCVCVGKEDIRLSEVDQQEAEPQLGKWRRSTVIYALTSQPHLMMRHTKNERVLVLSQFWGHLERRCWHMGEKSLILEVLSNGCVSLVPSDTRAQLWFKNTFPMMPEWESTKHVVQYLCRMRQKTAKLQDLGFLNQRRKQLILMKNVCSWQKQIRN